MKEVFDFLKSLTVGIPPTIRGGILVLIVICSTMYFMGFNIDSIDKIRADYEITESSIKLSNRIKKDESDVVTQMSHQIFADMDQIMGVAIFEFSPTLSPRVIKVITRDGESDFEDFFRLGREFHIGSTVPTMYGSIREGFPYINDKDDHYWIKDLHCESVISVAIMYRGICVGNIMVFLDKKLDAYGDEEIKYVVGNLTNHSLNIVEHLYYLN